MCASAPVGVGRLGASPTPTRQWRGLGSQVQRNAQLAGWCATQKTTLHLGPHLPPLWSRVASSSYSGCPLPTLRPRALRLWGSGWMGALRTLPGSPWYLACQSLIRERIIWKICKCGTGEWVSNLCLRPGWRCLWTEVWEPVIESWAVKTVCTCVVKPNLVVTLVGHT